jgi:hypothetical protein
MAHIAVQRTGTDSSEHPWEYLVTDDNHEIYSTGDATSRDVAFTTALVDFREMIEEQDVTITRHNQQTDTIYVGYSRFPWSSKDHLVVFVTPDGEGRYYFDSVAEAQRDMLDGDTFPIRYVARIED